MNILVVQTSFLGDVILSTPVLSSVQKIYPDAKITVLTTPQAQPLVQYHPAAWDTITFDKKGTQRGLNGFSEILREIRSRKFDIAFSLHRSFRTALLLRLADIPLRIGFAESAGASLYSRSVSRAKQVHEVLRNLSLLAAVGRDFSSVDQKLVLGIPDDVDGRMEEFLAQRTGATGALVGIAPGSVWATKRWTPAGFAQVARTLCSIGHDVVLVGGKEDESISREIERMAGMPLINAVGKFSLLESAALIRRCDVLVTNDSSPLHMASATGTPAVAIFCATVPEFGFGPWQIPSECVGVQGLSCRPCRRHGSEVCPTGTLACQVQLPPQRVVDAVERLIRVIEGKRNQEEVTVRYAASDSRR